MSDSPNPDPTFEESLAELEQIVHELEDGQTGLEDSLERYERGVNLLKRCYARLRQAEQRILLLSGVDEQGQPTLEPFQHSATADVAKVAARRKKKADEPEIPF